MAPAVRLAWFESLCSLVKTALDRPLPADTGLTGTFEQWANTTHDKVLSKFLTNNRQELSFNTGLFSIVTQEIQRMFC